MAQVLELEVNLIKYIYVSRIYLLSVMLVKWPLRGPLDDFTTGTGQPESIIMWFISLEFSGSIPHPSTFGELKGLEVVNHQWPISHRQSSIMKHINRFGKFWGWWTQQSSGRMVCFHSSSTIAFPIVLFYLAVPSCIFYNKLKQWVKHFPEFYESVSQGVCVGWHFIYNCLCSRSSLTRLRP